MKNILKSIGLTQVDQRENAESFNMYYITGPDGDPRWMWSSKLSKPEFLKFYYVSGFRSWMFMMVVKVIFALRLQHLFFFNQKIKVAAESDSLIYHFIESGFSVFTGTPGPNRKVLLFSKPDGSEGVFIKCAISKKSQALVQWESRSLILMNSIQPVTFSIPQLIAEDEQHNVLSDESTGLSRTSEFTAAHANCIREIQTKTFDQSTSSEFFAFHQIRERLEKLNKLSALKIPKGIIKKINYLIDQNYYDSLTTTFVHGDFTPWNMYLQKDKKLHVYDWEMASHHYPLAFDAIHYIFQKGILINKNNAATIMREAESALTEYKLVPAGEEKKYISYYLIINATNYLETYAGQDKWHTQINWLIQTWNEALSMLLTDHISTRELLIIDFFDFLWKHPYAGLKLSSYHPEKISEYSDLDIIADQQVSKSAAQFFKRHPLVKGNKYHATSSVSHFMILTQDDGLLHVDMIHELKQKSVQYMDCDQIISRATLDHDGIRRVTQHDMVIYIGLFYMMNGAPVPSRYQAYVECIKDGTSPLEQFIYGAFDHEKADNSFLRKYMMSQPFNRGLHRLFNVVNYYADVIRRFTGRGFIITFTGVDGSGKSTIIEMTKTELEKRFRKRVVVIRHRPSLLPILSAITHGKAQAENNAANKLPRQGQNKSTVGSLVRFLYYYTDYLFGQFVIYFKYVLTGRVVLYDRYYFDFIIDSLRSNIRLPRWFTRAGYKLLLKPELNFLLKADAEIITARKKELSVAEIEELTTGYEKLFYELNHDENAVYVTVENVDKKKTMSIVRSEILKKIA